MKNKSLVIIGGGLRYDNQTIFNSMIELAGGKTKAKIGVVPTASNHPQIYGNINVQTFRNYGVEAELIPVYNSKDLKNYETTAYDNRIADRVRQCTGIFFIGGLQHRIPQAFYTADGKDSPVLTAIKEVYENGGFIGGTSAGAAIMSAEMFIDGDSIDIMKRGAGRGGFMGRGLGLIGPDILVDQHFFSKGRFGRLLVGIAEKGYKLGFGIGENTAAVVTNNDLVEIIGYKGALVMDLYQSKVNKNIKEFNIQNVVISYIDRADTFSIKRKETVPSNYKKQGIFIDPNAPDFIPYNDVERFYPDIFANRVLRDLMWDFIDNNQKEVIGIAFSGLPDPNETEYYNRLGFEFRFRKSNNSKGYYTGVLGSEDYTVRDIHFDVTPIQMEKQLYTHLY